MLMIRGKTLKMARKYPLTPHKLVLLQIFTNNKCQSGHGGEKKPPKLS